LSVAAYRYSTGGFLSLTQAAEAREYAREGINAFDYVPPSTLPTIDGVPEQSVLTPAQQAALNGTAFTTNPILSATGVERQRNNFTLSLNQRLGQNGGSIYANVTASDYWNTSGNSTQFQIGYNNHFHRLNFGISATRSVTPLGRYDNEYFVNFSLPLGESPHAPTFMLNVTHDQIAGAQDQAIVNGTLGANNQFDYSATGAHNGDGGGNSGSVNVGYRSPYAVFNASYGDGSGYSQASAGVTGVIVAHPGGVTFGQPTGDTIGIVYVPGAAGAQLQSAPGVRVDRFGYAVVPYLTPYNLNIVQIDPKGLPLDVQLDATSAQVAPYEGAVVMLKFKTENGRALIVHASLENGEPLPFGAEVFNEKGTSLGVVGQGGQILVRGVNQSGRLNVRWDDNGTTQSCSFDYQVAARKDKKSKAYNEIQATCTRTDAVALVTRSGT
jgi:outer membrane usher protein